MRRVIIPRGFGLITPPYGLSLLVHPSSGCGIRARRAALAAALLVFFATIASTGSPDIVLALPKWLPPRALLLQSPTPRGYICPK